jgi:soluble lytic murein transglycosylase-like protein
MDLTIFERVRRRLWVMVQDAMSGFMLVAFNGFAMVGLLALCSLAVIVYRPDLRDAAEMHLLEWIEARQMDAGGIVSDIGAADRATASDPQVLSKEQRNIVAWLSKKYRVAPEPISALVLGAYEESPQHHIDPILILAVVAIESNFNPYAQSDFGAQGLMQVVTKIHAAKYKEYGGNLAAFDPMTNLRVGILVLRDCIRLKGSLEAGLRFYVGGTADNDGGYVGKVLAEYKRLQLVSRGVKIPLLGDVLFWQDGAQTSK